MANKTKELVIYIERNSISLSGGSLVQPIKLSFDEKTLSDLEIVDKKSFVESILSNIKKSETPTNLILIFSDEASFSKELPITLTNEQLEIEEKSFLSYMPFDKVAHKLIKFTDNYRLIGINSDMCVVISSALATVGYRLLMVLPVSVVSDYSQMTTFPDSLKIYNLIETNIDNKSGQINPLNPSKKFMLPALVGIFVILLVVLFYLLTRN